MRRDLLTLTGTFLSLALIVWAFWGNPAKSARMQTVELNKSDVRAGPGL